MNQRNTALKSHARNASAASAALFGHPILRTRLGEVLVFGGPKGHCCEAEHGNRPRVHVGAHGPRVPPRAGVLEPRCYAIVRMAVVDWRNIDEAAPRFVRDAVVCTGLDAGCYLELAGGVSLSKTHGRRALGCFDDLSCMFDPARIDMREKLQRRTTELLNCRFISKRAGHDGYGVPVERFGEDLPVLAERLWRLLPSRHLRLG